MLKDWTIYKIVNPKGAVYIGRTINFGNRLRYYKNGNCKGQKKLFSSFSKYGFGAHDVSIVEKFNGDMVMAGSKEMFWIRSFMSNCCKWPEMKGLNLTDGGEGNVGYKMSDESRRKISEYVKQNPVRAMLGKKLSPERIEQMRIYGKANPVSYWKGRKMTDEHKRNIAKTRIENGSYVHTDETKRKISESNKGKPCWCKGGSSGMKGRTHSEEVKKKVSDTKKYKNSLLSVQERNDKFGKHLIGATFNVGRKPHPSAVANSVAKRIKPVIQYALDGTILSEYPSITAAHLAAGVTMANICAILKGRISNPQRFIFKYKNI